MLWTIAKMVLITIIGLSIALKIITFIEKLEEKERA
ncbi:hypothetical protein CLTHE_14930 [Clostridium thermobutyricum DSM 4928]|uniref:Uncharacterized protein n=1 Tax=Clostridium thermobutyricum DSM 4928 TaxID=1121339 RepID=A0A1V4SWX5_9CLOT|nr:hypothetical protein CLTHE_14930 [Clostridium thermobutyricum DSM 4928]